MSRDRYRARGRTIEVECFAEVDIEDFATEVLVDELKRRSVPFPGDFRDEAVAVYEALRAGRADQAEWILERLLWPKWPSVKACEEQRAKMS